jgi:hypothetical protein
LTESANFKSPIYITKEGELLNLTIKTEILNPHGNRRQTRGLKMGENRQKAYETETQVSEETKQRLLDEKEKTEKEAQKYIRRHVRFRHQLILLSAEVLPLIPFFAITFFYSNYPKLYGSFFYVIILFFFLYVVVGYLGGIFLIRRRLKHTAKLVCFYTSVNAAQSLEKGSLVEGSFFVTKLLDFIKTFSEEEKVKIGLFSSSLKKLYLGDIEQLHEQKSAVGKAVLENGKIRTDFSNHLYILANSLFSTEEPTNFDKGIQSLKFFIENTKSYFQPFTYLQRHQKTSSIAKALSEIGKSTIVPLVLFILWLIFGYK